MSEKRNLSRTRIAITLLAISVAAAGGLYLRHKWMPYHFLTVTPEILYRSGGLSRAKLERVINQYQIRTIVALESEDESDPIENWYNEEKQLCEQKGIRFVYLPVETNTGPENQQIEEWLRLFDNPENQPILVHCAQGVSRTGMFVAIYQMELLGRENKEVLRELPMFGHEMHVERREPMVDFILNYEPRRKRAAPDSRQPAGVMNQARFLTS
jgi:protein tyrosine/serine phosphatase